MLKFFRILALGLLLGSLVQGPARAQEDGFSSDQIVDALTPKAGPNRGLQVKDGEKAEAPSISMRVQFAYDSDELENEAILSLRALGAARSAARSAAQGLPLPDHRSHRFQGLG